MKLRKVIAAVLAAAIMLSLTISASAERIDDFAVKIEAGKTYQATAGSNYKDCTYKFTVSAKTTITVTARTDFQYLNVLLLDADGNIMDPKSTKPKSGTIFKSIYDHYNLDWNENIEKGEGNLSYTLLKGTYYVQFKKGSGGKGGQDLLFKITDPNATSVTALSLSLTVDAGDILDLGGIVTPSNSKITWKSSDNEVATVSSTGEVEAIAAGTAKITATAGGKTASITLIVN